MREIWQKDTLQASSIFLKYTQAWWCINVAVNWHIIGLCACLVPIRCRKHLIIRKYSLEYAFRNTVRKGRACFFLDISIYPCPVSMLVWLISAISNSHITFLLIILLAVNFVKWTKFYLWECSLFEKCWSEYTLIHFSKQNQNYSFIWNRANKSLPWLNEVSQWPSCYCYLLCKFVSYLTAFALVAHAVLSRQQKLYSVTLLQAYKMCSGVYDILVNHLGLYTGMKHVQGHIYDTQRDINWQ